MTVYALDLLYMLWASASSSGRYPLNRKSMIGHTQDGTLLTVNTSTSIIIISADALSISMGCKVPGTDGAVPGCTGAVPGCARTTSGYIGPLPFNLVVTGSVGPVPGLLELVQASISIGKASRPAETNMESNFGDGIMDGFRRCSSDMPGGITSLDDPNLDKVSAASF
jgi:hypothetical protein